jgi:competence protein ComEA
MKQYVNHLVGILIGLILAGILWVIASQPRGTPVELLPLPTPEPIVVQVMGAVARPGVYDMPQDSRVRDVVQMAGGLLSDADKGKINLAAKLEDGDQIMIPTQTADSGGGTQELVDINKASADELDRLPGIGPTTAQKIVEYRQQHGPYARIEDLMQVAGIGPLTFEDIKDLITVGK